MKKCTWSMLIHVIDDGNCENEFLSKSSIIKLVKNATSNESGIEIKVIDVFDPAYTDQEDKK